ncbi:voltage-dependent calcium channel beta subunit-associated regulatory protein [Brachionichthys hirsutus]|uniref:voltage-dependent calcium channel beta subunit-associated regulatory protein n=1 Tax=Brachionichthys hirsutus TaxID=412623 RepID=UPI003604AA37
MGPWPPFLLHQDVPVSTGRGENYALLLVLLSVFAAGTLLLLALLLLFCHRCCTGGRRYSRASDDLEKTNTTYAEDSQPTQEITIHLDDSDALSAASRHDGESERFVSTGSTGRRVSFNESALYEQDKTTQDKARRYTLTEGDFHHLKKARLTHLHLPPSPCDMKILTIMECDSTESSTVNISESAAPKPPLAIYQTEDREEAESPIGMRGKLTDAPGQTSVLHFFSKLRRHASLEGAGPYFRRWKFDSSHRAASLDAKGSPKRRPFQRQRAASETTDHDEDDSPPLRDEAMTPTQTSGLQSLSAESLPHPAAASTSFLSRLKLEAMVELGSISSARREELGSPTNARHGQRQHASSNGNQLEEEEAKSGAVTGTEATGVELESAEDDDLFGVQGEAAVQEGFGAMVKRTKAELIRSDGRKRSEAELDGGDKVALGAEGRGRSDSGSSLSMIRQESAEAPPSLYRDIWSLRASLEQYASSDQSSTDRESIRSDADSASPPCGAGGRSGLESCLSQDLDDEPEGDGELLDGGNGGLSGGGVGGEGEAGNRKLLQMDSGYASIEAPSKAPEETRLFGAPGAPRGKTASERRLFFTSSGRKGSVCESVEAKLFQEELEEEMNDSAETEEKTKMSKTGGDPPLALQEPHQLLKSLHPQKPPESQPRSPLMKPHQPRLRRRDYSIDEKTDALFNEFLRHDPQFDQQECPTRSRHRSRVHLRKQWQRRKQYSDPGSGAGGRYSPSLDRQRFTPLRRGDSAGYPLDTKYHSTLSRIASAADEEASEVAASEEAAAESAGNKGPSRGGASGKATADTTSGATDPARSYAESTGEGEGRQVSTETDPRADNRNNNSSRAVPQQRDRSLADKLVGTLEDRLYSDLHGGETLEDRLYGDLHGGETLGQGGSEQVLTASQASSPGFGLT